MLDLKRISRAAPPPWCYWYRRTGKRFKVVKIILEGAYNCQFVSKGPCAYAHNPGYTLQLLYDSLGDLGARVLVDLGQAKRP